MYRHGDGVAKDAEEALHWFRLSAEQGLAEARFILGTMYHLGEGVPKDTGKAMRWIRLAAAQGHPQALCYREFLAANGERPDY